MKSLGFFDVYFSSSFGAASVADLQTPSFDIFIENTLLCLVSSGHKMRFFAGWFLSLTCTNSVVGIFGRHLIDKAHNIMPTLNIVDHISDS